MCCICQPGVIDLKGFSKTNGGDVDAIKSSRKAEKKNLKPLNSCPLQLVWKLCRGLESYEPGRLNYPANVKIIRVPLSVELILTGNKSFLQKVVSRW